jgi:ERCC4-type nuclease
MKKTQTSDILQHLKDGRLLTQKEAINEYGAYRLASIIHSLRNQGHNVESTRLDVPTRYKKKDGTIKSANIAQYTLKVKHSFINSDGNIQYTDG